MWRRNDGFQPALGGTRNLGSSPVTERAHLVGKGGQQRDDKAQAHSQEAWGGGAHGTRADQAPKGHETQAAGTAGGGAGTGPLETHKLETALEEEKAPASQPKVRGEAGVGGKMAGDTDACLGRLLRLP